jgi:DNA modification methylase
MQQKSSAKRPMRKVYCTDSLQWLQGKKFKAIITSLPDLSELKLSLNSYTEWLTRATTVLMNSVDENGCIIFYQTNRKLNGNLIDKEFLISNVFFQNSYKKIFQKVILRRQPGVIDLYRPSYSKMFCFSKKITSGPPSPDVIYTGKMVTSCAMGIDACETAIDFVLKKIQTDTVIDPFCGAGTVLAVANKKGLHAIGVDISKAMVSAARKLQVGEETAT